MTIEKNLCECDKFIDAHPEGSYFHKSAWILNLCDMFQKECYFLTQRNQLGSISGVLPLCLCRGIKGRSLVSVPFRDHGGPLVMNMPVLKSLIAEAKELAREKKAYRVSLHRPSLCHIDALKAAGFKSQLYGVDSKLDLSMSKEDYWNALSSPVRRAVKKAGNSGIELIEDISGRNLEVFFKYFISTRRRLGVPSYPKEYFSNMIRSGTGQCVLIVARLNGGEVLGGLMLMCHGINVYSGYLGYSKNHQLIRVVDALFYKAICWSRENGARWFFFGADSPKQKTLIKYKEKWLARAEPVWSWHWTAMDRHYHRCDTESFAYKVVRRVFRALPLSVFKKVSRLSLNFWE